MLILVLLLAAALDTTLSTPVILPGYNHPIANPLALFGRQLPPCMDIRRYRTKNDIVWSCLATIFACTWVAVHPNVPNQRDSEWQKFKIRVRTMIYALIAPEFITMWALRQRIGAAKHAAHYNEKFFPESKLQSCVEYVENLFREPDPLTDGCWTLTHGFLLEMHGLYWRNGVELSNISQLEKPIEVPEKEISDKSKGDFLTKLFVVVQTTWFIVQCLGRWITHLSVTQLEVVTLAFAVLNIITYILWWNKPQAMHVPIWIKEDDTARFRQDWCKLHEEPTEDEGSADDEINPEPPAAHDEKYPVTRKLLLCVVRLGRGLVNSVGRRIIRTVDFLVAFGQLGIRGASLFMTTVGELSSDIRDAYRDLLEEGILYLIFLGPFVTLMLVLAPLMGLMHVSDSVDIDRTFHSSEGGVSNIKISMAVFTVSVAFGGLHIIPLWTVSFPSSAEKLLWQICSLCIIVIPLLLLIMLAINQRVASNSSESLSAFSSLFIGFTYAIARVILLVIAVATLRDIPPEAYRNIEWTTVLPHL